MTKQLKVYRQGDVWIYEITKGDFLGSDRGPMGQVAAHPEKGVILAEGEVTGHHHRIPEVTRVALRAQRNGDGTVRLLEVKKAGVRATPVSLVHEEHETIKIPPGYYEVRIQREYAPTERAKQSYVRD